MSSEYDSQEFIKVLLEHLYRSPVVFRRAKELGLKSSDLLSAAVSPYTLPLHKTVLDILFELNASPVNGEVAMSVARSWMHESKITELEATQAVMLIAGITASQAPLMEQYVADELPKFIKYRREAQILANAAGSIDKIRKEYAKLILPLELSEAGGAEERFVKPFETILKKTIIDLIPTGFPKLNAALGGGGLGLRELGLIIGHSGGGKTAMGVSFARGAALSGRKVIYVSMEEQPEDISARLYSAVFDIDYTSLHNGRGYMELDSKIAAVGADSRQAKDLALLKSNFVLLDLKGLTPVKPMAMKEMLDKYAKEHDFMYELVVVDQLQFMEPDTTAKDQKDYQKEAQTVADLDNVSHQPIEGTTNYYGMWVLHQAKGKVKIYFSTEEISGFKGIVHKPETVLGIGREDPASSNFEVFSMKNRHAKNFRLPMTGDLTFMRFIENAEAGGDLPLAVTGGPSRPKNEFAANAGDSALSLVLSNAGPPSLRPPPVIPDPTIPIPV